jgi:hypothetical protein
MAHTAKIIVDQMLSENTQHDVVMVYEDGTTDPFYALYIDGKLIETNPRGHFDNMLSALGITIRQLFVTRGFDGNFPESLASLKTYYKE